MATSGLSTSAAPSFIHSGNSSGSNSSRFRPCAHLSHRGSFFGAELDHRDVLFGALRLRRGKRRRELRFLVSAHLGHPEDIDSALNFLAQAPDTVQNVLARAEGWLYTVADAAVATDAATEGAQEAAKQAQQNDWFSGVTKFMEITLTLLKDLLSKGGVPYAYGFAIIMLTVIVKLVTFPLTKQQMESSMAMQGLQPKIKAIQERYKDNKDRVQIETARLYKQAGVNPLAGCLPALVTMPVWIGLYRALSNVANEGLLNEGFFWIPSLAGPTTVAARQTGSGTAWLFPFVDGAPPLGWNDTIAYLVLPVLLVASQFAALKYQQMPQTDQNQGAQQVLLKFLPFMIGYFALSVPSGLSLYWLTNNILSTGQQALLKNMVGKKPVKGADGGDIITAGQAKRSSASAPAEVEVVDFEKEKEIRRGERFKKLKEAEAKRKAERAARRAKKDTTAETDTETDTEDDETTMFDEEVEDEEADSVKDSLEGLYANSTNGAASDGSPNKRKRSKRKRSV